MPAYSNEHTAGMDMYSSSTTSTSGTGWLPSWATQQLEAGANSARQLVQRLWKAKSTDTLPTDAASSGDAEGAEGDTAPRDQGMAASQQQPGHRRARSWSDAWAQLPAVPRPQLRLKDVTQHLPALPPLPFGGLRRDDPFALPVTNQQAGNMLLVQHKREQMMSQGNAAVHALHWPTA